jgi:hypothetical protein
MLVRILSPPLRAHCSVPWRLTIHSSFLFPLSLRGVSESGCEGRQNREKKKKSCVVPSTPARVRDSPEASESSEFTGISPLAIRAVVSFSAWGMF